MTRWISLFAAALGFLTRLPVKGEGLSLEDVGRAVGLFPLVGAVVGAFLAGGWCLFSWVLPPLPAAVLALGLWLLITGGLHVDGLADCCDGLLAAKSPAERLEIMRDTAVGSFGVMGVAWLLIAKVAFISAMPNPHGWVALFPVPVLGRWAVVYAIVRYPYARAEGLGSPLKRTAGPGDLALATVIALAASLVPGPQGAAILVSVWAFTLIFARWVRSRIPGFTGDVYGALCELSELVALAAFVILWRLR